MKLIFINLSNIMNISFMTLNHPMSMMMFVIMQTFNICLITGMSMESFWLSYILFLMFLGGMLVLFIYITSIASNEMFYLNYSNMLKITTTLITTIIISVILNTFMIIESNSNSDLKEMNQMNFLQELSMSLEKIYNNPTFNITLMLMIYLFLTLLIVVKITNINCGPIRKIKF